MQSTRPKISRIGGSWSGFRSRYERDFLAPSLQGRLRFFCTRSHGIDDEVECVVVKFDGKEILRSTQNKYWDKWWENKARYKVVSDVHEFYELIDREAVNSGCFLIRHLFKASHDYLNQPIESSLIGENALVRMFAVLDRRVGKRRLRRLVGKIDEEPEWLRQFYIIRLECEGIKL